MWRELFEIAGLKWGRDKGLVWHTLRHEFCCRTAENTGDPQAYLHPRLARVLQAAVKLNRKWCVRTASDYNSIRPDGLSGLDVSSRRVF